MDWATASAALEERAAAAFDVHRLRLVPRKAGASVNHAMVDDGSRTAFDFDGTLETNPPGVASERRMASDPSARQQMTFFEGVVTAHAASWPWQPRRGDLILKGDDVYQVMGVDRDGSARPIIHVNRGR